MAGAVPARPLCGARRRALIAWPRPAAPIAARLRGGMPPAAGHRQHNFERCTPCSAAPAPSTRRRAARTSSKKEAGAGGQQSTHGIVAPCFFRARGRRLNTSHPYSRVYKSAKSNISTCGLVAMTSASHAEGRQLDPGQVYLPCRWPLHMAASTPGAGLQQCWGQDMHIHLARIELATFSVLG